eukprot:8469128-Prorocentrum_lima.AAC.1
MCIRDRIVKGIRSQRMSAALARMKGDVVTKRRCTGSEDVGITHQETSSEGHAESCVGHHLQ